MSSDDSSSISAASGSQGTGLWVTAAIAMAIIVGGPLFIHSGVERAQPGGEGRHSGRTSAEQSAAPAPASAKVSSSARSEAGGGSAQLQGAAAAAGDAQAASSLAGGGISFGPGSRVRTLPAAVPAQVAADQAAPGELAQGNTTEASVADPSPDIGEPLAAGQGPSGSSEPEKAAAEPPSGGPVEDSSVADYGRSAPQEPESEAAPELVVPPRGQDPAKGPVDQLPAAAPSGVAVVAEEIRSGAQSVPASGYQFRPHLGEVVRELRSMQREAEMEKQASEAARPYPPGFGRPFYPGLSVPRAAPGGYGYYRQGPSAFYPPQGQSWGYPGPGPQGRGWPR